MTAPAAPEHPPATSKRPTFKRPGPILSWAAVVALMVGIVFSLVAFWGLRGWERAAALQRAEAHFEEQAEHVSLLVQREVSRHLATVEAVEALFEASEVVTRAEFDTFTRVLLARNPNIRRFAWAPQVSREERSAFEAGVRRGLPGFEVRAGAGGTGEVLFPIEFMSPSVGPAELGLDLASVPALRDAAMDAASRGRGVAVGPLPLAPLGGGEGVGVAVLVPFYRAPTEAGGPVLRGFVVELLDIATTVRTAVGDRSLDAWLSDSAGQPLMAWHAGVPMEATHAPPTTAGATQSRLIVGDQLWILTLAPSQAAVPYGPGGAAWFVLSVGLAASAGGAAYLERLRRHAEALSAANAALNREMTWRKEAERTRERLSDVVDATSDLVAMADPGDHLFYLNPAGRALVGLGEREDVGRTLLTDLMSHESRVRIPPPGPEPEASLWQGEIELCSPDGTEIPALGVIQTHLGADGAVEYRSAIAHDIRERKAAERQLERHAYYDELTDLPNRRLLERRLGEAIGGDGGAGRVAVLLVNPDRFRFVSYALGPAYRDLTMRALARRFEALVRPGETLTHYVGDTFALVLPEAGFARVQRVRDALFEAMAEPLTVDGADVRLGISIGACFYPDDGGDVAALLRYADAALNEAMEEGGGSCQFFTSELHQRLQERVTIEAELRCALERDELTLYYQPQVDLASGRLAGVEALLRWRHPRLGLLGPGHFVKIAEESRLILPIGDWAIENACRQARKWREAGVPPLQIGVNVSASQLGQADLEGRIRRAMREGRIHPGELELELTESALMADPDEVREIFGRLRDNGCRIAIDDFGTGYSCLSYLKQLPVDRLKIDQSFVRDVVTDASSAGIVRTIIAMAGHIGLATIAEGVSDAAQVDFLRREGCPEIQGYFVSRPVPPDEIPPLESALRAQPLMSMA
ncbi:MAG: EAL domain-containing protein [Pseudomonadota bacterium]|nr:EAL domain-containing protein [Pseudomonadota bacterium]